MVFHIGFCVTLYTGCFCFVLFFFISNIPFLSSVAGLRLYIEGIDKKNRQEKRKKKCGGINAMAGVYIQ